MNSDNLNKQGRSTTNSAATPHPPPLPQHNQSGTSGDTDQARSPISHVQVQSLSENNKDVVEEVLTRTNPVQSPSSPIDGNKLGKLPSNTQFSNRRPEQLEEIRRATFLNNPSHSPTSLEAYPYGDEKSNFGKGNSQKPIDCWTMVSRAMTWWAPSFMLRSIGIRDKYMQQAWREKVTLVQIIILLCAAVGFLTFGFNATVCGIQPNRIRPTGVEEHHVIIHGRAFDLNTFRHPTPFPDIPASGDLQELGVGGHDLSFMFQTVNYNCKGIFNPIQPDDEHGNVVNYFPCVALNRYNPDLNATDNPGRQGCHISKKARLAIRRLDVVGDVYYNWTDIQKPGTSLVAFNGNVLDLSRLRYLTPNIPLPAQVAQIVGPGSAFIGRDATYWLSTTSDRLQIGKCLTDILKVGVVDTRSTGCIISDIVLWISLAVILGVVFIRFFLALIFGWFVSGKLGSIREETDEDRRRRREKVLEWEMNNVEQMHYRDQSNISIVPPAASSAVFNQTKPANSSPLIPSEIVSTHNREENGTTTASPQQKYNKPKRRFFPTTSRFTQPNTSRTLYQSPSRSFGLTVEDGGSPNISQFRTRYDDGQHALSLSFRQAQQAKLQAAKEQYKFNFDLIHTFMVVTCYSEGEEGLRTTLDSLANTDYPATHKMLIVVCDGIITGSGNGISTPDIVLSMMKDDVVPREQVQPSSYVAIADGSKRHNMAKVYAGYYKYNEDTSKMPEVIPEDQQQRVPMIVVVKCGTDAERSDIKPGNRGKRDSQVILMNAMQKVYYAERMCDLEYQFCKAVFKLSGVHPSEFETCLMVDADTKVYPDSLARMVACMSRDPSIMGLCGETKIANKSDSWITAIQVFEYYISHHMSKAFESIFGGVTCLPGCFCMYRILAPKAGKKVPIFCAQDIVEKYCENVVDSLHKKNLLLLGEDRYLTTLMLRTFPKRKMMFVPQAVCKTVVPDTFKVLLSQRRRWINSTVHNLLELVLIRDLCGTFCFSMQFVVFMELVGTVVLPAAISFTLYLIIISFFVKPIPLIPLLLLAVILGLPAVLIAITTFKMIYVMWMFIYLLSLPIWNFVLPAYAYWHFDDFSWGQTRVVEGQSDKGEDHGRREGEFDSSGIVMHRFEEWVRLESTMLIEARMAASNMMIDNQRAPSYAR